MVCMQTSLRASTRRARASEAGGCGLRRERVRRRDGLHELVRAPRAVAREVQRLVQLRARGAQRGGVLRHAKSKAAGAREEGGCLKSEGRSLSVVDAFFPRFARGAQLAGLVRANELDATSAAERLT
jgi:hypothetical protein